MSTPAGVLIEAQVADRGLDIAFEVAEGETVALLGPNGAGKSTTLAVLSGLLRPDSGRVVVGGDEVTGPHRWVRPHARRTALERYCWSVKPFIERYLPPATPLKP